MSKQQPEALLLADWLDHHGEKTKHGKAAAKLRRLHALNGELLAALWGMVTSFHAVEWMEPHMRESADKARAAIAKATGEA
jgi:hypothetical protein